MTEQEERLTRILCLAITPFLGDPEWRMLMYGWRLDPERSPLKKDLIRARALIANNVTLP